MSTVHLVERREEDGRVWELYTRAADIGEAYDVFIDGVLAMSSDQRHSEQPLAEYAITPWQGRDDINVLVAGMGMGHVVRAVLDTPGVARVDVVEVSRAMLDWEKSHFTRLNGGAMQDPRVHVHHAELSEFLAARGAMDASVPAEGWFAIILDLDEWPTTVTRPGNEKFYSDIGLEMLEAALRPGGVLGIWTTQKDDALLARLGLHLQNPTKVAVPVDRDGASVLDHMYRARRGPKKPVN